VPLQHFCVKRHSNQYIFTNNNNYKKVSKSKFAIAANSIALAGSKLTRTSFEPASVMEFGFY